jgi:hypothetical protein
VRVVKSLQVREFRFLTLIGSILLPNLSKLPFAIYPLSYVLRTVHDFSASKLTDSQETNDIQIDERQFLQIQNDCCSVRLKVSRQFLDVLRVKMTNQANRRSAAARFRLDLQCLRRFV